jgi:transmembrane sensor
MSKRAHRSRFNAQIYEEACAWFTDMRAGDVDAAGRRRFDDWVRRSPEHLRAYLEISEIWDDALLADAALNQGSDELIERALRSTDVVRFAARVGGESPSPLRSERRPERKPSIPRLLVATAVAVGCITVAWVGFLLSRVPTYTTGIGEQRFVTLEDGSRVELNSRTRLLVRFTNRARTIELLQGQALFQVAKNRQRPFIVVSGGVQVQAVGTQFDVDHRKRTTIVTVLEGQVAVQTEYGRGELPGRQVAGDTHPAMPVILSAGEQVALPGGSAARPVHANVAAAISWTHGSLIFEGTRLRDVVEEFNRYNTRQLIIRDSWLEDISISGVYSSTNPALLLRFLREQPGVSIQETSNAVLISAAKN